MKKIINYLLSSIAVIIFLASSTGISFVIHHCADNHTSEFHLFVSDYQCKHEKAESCCSFSNNYNHNSVDCKINKHHKCCSNTAGYIKVNDQFNSLCYQFNFNPPLFLNLSRISFIHSNKISFSCFSLNSSPPNIFKEKDLFTHISQFLI